MPGILLSPMAAQRGTRDNTGPDLYLISENDVIYEQDVLSNPGAVKPWLEYATYKKRYGSTMEQAFVLERACTALPRSYKLWKMYLELRIRHLKGRNATKQTPQYAKVNSLFERALVLLNKMPRIWEMYLSFLMQQPLVTFTRQTFDRALRALPVTQHNRIWALYRPFATSASGETATKIWKRYMQIHPEDAEEFIELLLEMHDYTAAVQQYITILNNPHFKSKEAKGPFEFWTEMMELLIDHATDIRADGPTGIDVPAIIRSGIARFPDQRGILWIGLARYWINAGDAERARDAFEEGVTTVMTVRDFTMVFDTYAEAEEAVIGLLMDAVAQRGDGGSARTPADARADVDLDLRLLRFEALMDRRAFLLNDVLLRQNPHNVAEWAKRVALWGANMTEAVATYTAALAAIHPKRAQGQLHELWVAYARLYEDGGDLATARLILEKAVRVPFRSVAELAETWCAFAELELRAGNFDGALAVMAAATRAPQRSRVDYFDETLTPQQRVHKSWKAWSFRVDLVESVGDLPAVRAVYDRVFELRIATPQTVVNYANLLADAGYHEDSFRVFERGLDLFAYPVAFELWNLYLARAVARRVALERLRDLFEQALDGVPPRFAKPLYLMYAALEEERGLARHAMRIYERATRAVADADRADVFRLYVAKSAGSFGLAATRPVYERAVAALPDAEAKDMCLAFADMERRLGEVDRARAVYGHASQFADPRVDAAFWAKWEAFEVACGNEDTFKEMLRVKRSVQAQYKYVDSSLPFPCPACCADSSATQYRRQLHRFASARAQQADCRCSSCERRTECRRRRRHGAGHRHRRHGGTGTPSARPCGFRGIEHGTTGRQHFTAAAARAGCKPRRH